MTDLGSLPGINFSAGGSINVRGWIAGQGSSSTLDPNLGVQEGRALLWTNRQLLDLGDLPGGHESLSVYVDDNDEVVGFSDNGIPDMNSLIFFPTGTQIRTFLWQNGRMRDIGTLGGASAVPGILCQAQPRSFVVGASFVDDNINASTGVPTIDPFLWKDGKMIDLGTLGGTIGSGTCSNSREEIIGQSNLSGDVQTHAFLWHNGEIHDLGTLGGPLSESWWINDSGMIVGSADLPSAGIHDAVIWKDGKIRDLGTVAGDACSRGYGLNTHGQAVGGSTDCKSFLHAFLWEGDGPMLDLNKLIAPGSGWQLTNAFNINDHGVILAKAAPLGFTPNDDEDLGHLVLLFPCGDEDERGCGTDFETTTALSPASGGQNVTQAPNVATNPQPQTPRENVEAWRARFAGRYRVPEH
jgi:probable HAF family extracellular repeat protein